jgi:hypothetical protein
MEEKPREKFATGAPVRRRKIPRKPTNLRENVRRPNLSWEPNRVNCRQRGRPCGESGLSFAPRRPQAGRDPSTASRKRPDEEAPRRAYAPFPSANVPVARVVTAVELVRRPGVEIGRPKAEFSGKLVVEVVAIVRGGRDRETCQGTMGNSLQAAKGPITLYGCGENDPNDQRRRTLEPKDSGETPDDRTCPWRPDERSGPENCCEAPHGGQRAPEAYAWTGPERRPPVRVKRVG